jgi:hypothetical protein
MRKMNKKKPMTVGEKVVGFGDDLTTVVTN